MKHWGQVIARLRCVPNHSVFAKAHRKITARMYLQFRKSASKLARHFGRLLMSLMSLQLPPATRRDFDLFNKRYEQQSNFVQPKYLPPACDMPPELFAEAPRNLSQRETGPSSFPSRCVSAQ